LCFGIQQTTMEALAQTLDGNLHAHKISGRSSSRGSSTIPRLLHREHWCRSRARRPALCGCFSGAGADCDSPGANGTTGCRRQCFYALINAFFISLVALIPHINFGTLIVPFSSVSLLTSLLQAWSLLRPRKGWQSFVRRAILVCLSLGLYGLELRNAVGLITDPTQVGFVYGQLFVLLGTFALGLSCAWELLGAQRYGFGGWLNPLQDVHDGASFSRADTSDSASGPPTTDEAAPRSPPQ